MKIVTKRKIAFALIIIFAVFITIWNIFSFNELLKNKIIEDIYKNSQGTILLSAQNMSLGPGYLSIDSVLLNSNNKNTKIYLNIGRVKIHYRIWPLFIFKTSMSYLLKNITLENPVFRINVYRTQQNAQNINGRKNFIKIYEFFKLNDKIPAFNVINARAELYHKNNKWVQMTNLNGYLKKNNDDIIEAHLVNTKNDTSLFEVSILYRPDSMDIDQNLIFHNFPIRAFSLINQTPYLKFKSGNISGNVKFYTGFKDSIFTFINGRISLHYLNGDLFDKLFSADSFIVNLQNNKFTTSTSQILWGSNELEMELKGLLGEKPELDGFFQSRNFDLSSLNYYLNVKENLQGLLNITGIFRMGPSNFLKTSFHSPRISYKNFELQNVLGETRFAENQLFIKVESKNHKYALNSFVSYNLKSKDLHGDLKTTYKISTKKIHFLRGIDRSLFASNIQYSGNWGRKSIEGNINLALKNHQSPIVQATGTFALNEDSIRIAFADSAQDYPLSFQLVMDNLRKKPEIGIMEIYNIPLYRFIDKKLQKFIPQNVLTSLYLSGEPDYLIGKIKIFNSKTLNNVLEFTGKVEHLFSEYAEFEGNLGFNILQTHFNGRYFIASQPYKWHGFFYLGDHLKSEVNINYAEKDPNVQLSMEMENFPLISCFNTTDSLKWGGALSGKVHVKGPLTDLNGEFSFNANDIVLDEVGYWDFQANGGIVNNRIHVDSLLGKINNLPFLKGHLSLDLGTKQFNGFLKGENFALYNLSELVWKNRDLLKGNMNYTISFNNTSTQQMGYEFQCTIPQLKIKNEKFSNLTIHLRDSLKSLNIFDRDNHVFYLDHLSLESEKNYRMNAYGLLPFSEKQEMNLNIKLDGNVLAHLHSLLPFFTSVNVNGEAQVLLAGNINNARLDSLNLNITEGEVEFQSVLKPLRHIKMDVVKRKGDPFVKINKIEGYFENSFVHVHNLKKVYLKDGRELQPWKFDGLNLDFGTLVLKTDKGGIPLNILGLQEPGDFGYYSVKGLKPGEEFYFSGPVEKPYVRGIVVGRNARITFPFLTFGEDSTESNKVVDFLMGVQWDVLAKAAKGTYYFVEIPAYVGKVYMELNVDINSPGLHFTGVLNDDSFRASGEVFSFNGHVEYLETNFRVGKFGAIFNKYELFPEVYGKAYTTVRDSLDIPHEIYLQLYAIDPETKQERQRGRWEDFRFKLVSNEPVIGDNQELVLAQMGYSVKNLSSKVTQVGSQLTENLLIRPLVRPLERFLEKKLKIDYVRFRSAVAKNLMNYSLGSQFKWWNRENSLTFNNPYISIDPTFILLQSSEMTFGKYLDRNLYLSYTAQLMAMYESVGLHLNQKINLEYRLLGKLLLEFEYDYFKYSQYRYLDYNKPYDFIVRLRHSFNF